MVSTSGLVAGIRLYFCLVLKMQMDYWDEWLEKKFLRMQWPVEILKKCWYLSYFPIAMISHEDQDNLLKERFIWVYGFWRMRIHCGSVAVTMNRSQSKKIRTHTPKDNYEADSVHKKWDQNTNTWSPLPVMVFLYWQRFFYVLKQCHQLATNWRPSEHWRAFLLKLFS